ncbi:MAG: mevalonate kinase [Methanobrevibacter sp.]|jgi:mevalonate kinase|nr:mevalonate kinase [Candidatus Methanoflexus mossambicus]
MESVASAPGKTILFGEHAVVYNQPAIAVAVDKRAVIRIKKSSKGVSTFWSNDLGFEAELDIPNKNYKLIKGRPGIIRYVLEILNKWHDNYYRDPLDIKLSLNIPIGSGLGSSAAVTVATLAALFNYHGFPFNKKVLAKEAHKIEKSVQGMASPLDTAVSTYGGLIYLSRNKEISEFKLDIDSDFVIGFTEKKGNTGAMVKSVNALKDRNPRIVSSIIETMGQITDEAKDALLNKDYNKLADLMNLNQGFLDAIGVNTFELSRMIYTARKNGAIGAKITGAGGGGSIIALAPNNALNVVKSLNVEDKGILASITHKGALAKVRK